MNRSRVWSSPTPTIENLMPQCPCSLGAGISNSAGPADHDRPEPSSRNAPTADFRTVGAWDGEGPNGLSLSRNPDVLLPFAGGPISLYAGIENDVRRFMKPNSQAPEGAPPFRRCRGWVFVEAAASAPILP